MIEYLCVRVKPSAGEQRSGVRVLNDSPVDCQTPSGTESQRDPTVAVASSYHKGNSILFCLPRKGGGAMYLTLEQFILICGFILALLTYIDSHNDKNKKN